jgi:hypothetical protein
MPARDNIQMRSTGQCVQVKRRKLHAKSRGRKKTARLAGGFSGISGALRALTPLSIRQRSEMPKKVKVKLGGHGELRLLIKNG